MTSPFARRREPVNGGDVNPLPPLRGDFPQRGKISLCLIFPLWGKWPEGPKGALFSVFPVPREGGDPDRGQPTVRASQVWAPAFAGDADEGKNKPDACVIFA